MGANGITDPVVETIAKLKQSSLSAEVEKNYVKIPG